LLGQEMSRLTLHQQRVMQLLVQGLNTQEVAKQLGCTDRAVYNCKHAAVNRLRKGLNQ
jgi:DNA-binding NarL/FixJ family response regulator